MLMYHAYPHEPILHNTTQLTMYGLLSLPNFTMLTCTE